MTDETLMGNVEPDADTASEDQDQSSTPDNTDKSGDRKSVV